VRTPGATACSSSPASRSTNLVSANLLFPLTQAGLRDRVTPSIGIDYRPRV
jgi:hypothetical protein